MGLNQLSISKKRKKYPMADRNAQDELEKRNMQKRIEELERNVKEANQRAEKAEKEGEEGRRTTLDEYIAACHTCIFTKFTIKPKPKLSTNGPITDPCNKWCPKYLKPWTDFINQQKLTFGILENAFPMDSRVFGNRGNLADTGDIISISPITDEKSLDVFLRDSLDSPVIHIVEKLKEVKEVTAAFAIGDGIVFENHFHTLSDVAQEVVEKETLIIPQTPDRGRNPNRLRPDRICITRPSNKLSAPRRTVYISEYKSPIKLTLYHLRAGLRPMDIYKEVVNRKTIPTSADLQAKLQYNAERLVASAITQTYHYMIEAGIEYGNLSIGEATVFLKIDWKEPETLRYHLAEPIQELLAYPNSFRICTAVGQHLAFALMALGSPGEQHRHGEEERYRAMNNLKTWVEDFETTVRSIPENERLALLDYSPGYKPTKHDDFERLPYPLRNRKRRISQQDIKESFLRRDNGREPSDDESAMPPDTPTPGGQSTGQSSQRNERPAQQPGGDKYQQGRQYCTQKCLLGLVQGDFLDPKCPNIAFHSKNYLTGARHPVSHKKWLELLWKQLKQSLDDGIIDLNQGGARGVLFKITLLVYGYTFVAKGTVRAFISDLEHEAAVYDRLRLLQGCDVPVFLGAIDLRTMNKVYYYFHRVYVVYMMFLSWGGDSLDDALKTGRMGKELENATVTSLRAIHQQGVIHKDVRFENMLFNQELQKVMIIDFERASLLELPRPALVQPKPNKRKRDLEEKELAS
ncbi:hypothetical protein F4774DRAFT_429041 [Daldinia eschscholtzii]|nr:hypothetical protein F4774DRAFT_429041 [Daldinia eschscholtzii]